VSEQRREDAIVALCLIVVVASMVIVRSCLGAVPQELPASPPESFYQSSLGA